MPQGSGPPRVALAWAHQYSTGMANLGLHHAWRLFLQEGASVERWFLDNPGARTLESNHPLARFDMLAFSIPFEMDYPAVLHMLDKAGLPLQAARRSGDQPLVLFAGMGASVAPLPLVPFVDVLARGEAEVLIPAIVQAWRASPQRKDLLESLAALPGCRVTPGAARAAGLDLAQADVAALGATETMLAENKRIEAPALEVPPPAREPCWPGRGIVSQVVTPSGEFGERHLAEIGRGCPHHCVFCWMGSQCGDFSTASSETILSELESARAQSGCSSVGLISSAVGAHPQIDALCRALLEKKWSLSFSSLRAEETTDTMLDALAESGQRSITLAPETGDAPSRRRLAKAIPDGAFFDLIQRAQVRGIPDVKLYFMLGLPGEEPEAPAQIELFCRKSLDTMKPHGQKRGALGTLSVNLGIYVPKPGTPLSGQALPPAAAIKHSLREAARHIRRLPNTRVAASSLEAAQAQAILANDGLSAALYLWRLWHGGGQWKAETRRWIAGK